MTEPEQPQEQPVERSEEDMPPLPSSATSTAVQAAEIVTAYYATLRNAGWDEAMAWIQTQQWVHAGYGQNYAGIPITLLSLVRQGFA